MREKCRIRKREWLFILLLQSVVPPGVTTEERIETAHIISLDTVWAASDTITLTLKTYNNTQHKVTVSVRPENNNNSVLIVDQLPKQPTHINHTRPHTYQHTIRELTSDTRYHVCVEARQWGGVEGAGPGEEVILQGGCYSVKTLPQVDNISGLYASLAAVGSFLVVVMVGWVLYVMVWGKWLSKLLPNKDKYEVERPAEGQPNPAYTTTQIITNT